MNEFYARSDRGPAPFLRNYAHARPSAGVATLVVTDWYYDVGLAYCPSDEGHGGCSGFETTLEEHAMRGWQASGISIIDEAMSRAAWDMPEYDRGSIIGAVVIDGLATIGTIGNCRAYMVSDTGAIRRITRDHTVTSEEWSPDVVNSGGVFDHAGQAELTRMLIPTGIARRDVLSYPDIYSVPIMPGHTLFLCSDGLHGMVSDEAMRFIVRGVVADGMSPCLLATRLIEAAIDAGAEDNIAIALYRRDNSIRATT